MTIASTSALAVAFDHVTAAPDVTLTFASGPSPVTASLATRAYCMWLRHPGGAALDYLGSLRATIKAAIDAAGRSETVDVALSAAGVVTYTLSGAFATCTFADSVWHRLGLASATPAGGTTIVGARPVWHLALLVGETSNDWAQQTVIASAETIAGVGYGVSSGVTTWSAETGFDFIPRDPAYVTSLGAAQTPWEPDAAYLAALGTPAARTFSISDLLAGALGRTLGYARNNWQTVRTDTTARYDLVTIPGREIARPRVTRLVSGWDAYRQWSVLLMRQSATPTGTRA